MTTAVWRGLATAATSPDQPRPPKVLTATREKTLHAYQAKPLQIRSDGNVGERRSAELHRAYGLWFSPLVAFPMLLVVLGVGGTA